MTEREGIGDGGRHGRKGTGRTGARTMNAKDEARVRWRHEDCDPSACVATMELGCEAVVLLATLDAERARLQGDPGLLREALAWAHDREREVRSDDWAFGAAYANAFRDEFIPKLEELLAASPPEPEPLDVERLARAEHASYAREPGAQPIKWSDLTPNEKSMWRRHAAVRAAEYARLSEPETP